MLDGRFGRILLSALVVHGVPVHGLGPEPRAERAQLEAGSAVELARAFERIEAELQHDVAAALASADECLAVARRSARPGELEAASALRELARAMRDGPAGAAEPPTALLGSDVPPALRAVFHGARARALWLEDRPTDVLSHALAGLEAARESGDVVLRLRSAWFVHDITEDEAPSYDAELVRELERLAREPAAERFAPWRLLNEYWGSYSLHSNAERQALLDEAARAAQAANDLDTLCRIDWDRAVLAAEMGELEPAFARLESARATSARAGLRRELATSFEIAAGLALDHGELERCAEFLRQGEEVVAGRGFPDKDMGLAHLRLRLASAAADEAGIVAWHGRLDGLRRAEGERHRGYPAVRLALLGADSQRIAQQQGLAEAEARAAQRLEVLRRYVGGGIVLALGLLVAIGLHSRRKLQRANARLQEELRRAEGETRARQALEQRMRLLERSQSLGLVASGIAHDFNNLMAGVLGNAELLRLDESDPERCRLLDAIAGAGVRGARLCGQLQAYSSDEAAALEPLDLGPLLGELALVLAVAAGPELEFELAPPPVGLVVDGNRAQLEQAILNLVANARDAQARHLRLRLTRAARTEADWSSEPVRGAPRAGEFACLEVEDDGEGMSAEWIERIFDPFFSTRFPGRGLGLAVVQGTLRRHAGLVAVHSAPGKGSRFRLYLPLRNAAAHTVPSGQATGDEREYVLPARPLNILVVDDEADVREYVRVALEARGHRVATTEDGAAAVGELRALGGTEPMLALVDLSMPVTDGRDVVRALRTELPASAIVLMSGHQTAFLAETARELAADGYIAKPFTRAELERALWQALDVHACRTQASRASIAPAL